MSLVSAFANLSFRERRELQTVRGGAAISVAVTEKKQAISTSLTDQINQTGLFIIEKISFSEHKLIFHSPFQLKDQDKKLFYQIRTAGASGEKFHIVLSSDFLKAATDELMTIFDQTVAPYTASIQYKHLHTSQTHEMQRNLVRVIDKARCLETLDLSDCKNLQEGLLLEIFMAVIGGLTTLKLDDHDAISEGWLVNSLQLQWQRHLRSISLVGCKNITENAVLEFLRSCPYLREIHCKRMQIGDSFFDFISSSDAISLTHLAFDIQQLSEKAITCISNLPKLQEIELSAPVDPHIRARLPHHLRVLPNDTQYLSSGLHSVYESVRPEKKYEKDLLITYLNQVVGPTAISLDGEWLEIRFLENRENGYHRQILSDEISQFLELYKVSLTVDTLYSNRLVQELTSRCFRLKIQNIDSRLQSLSFPNLEELILDKAENAALFLQKTSMPLLKKLSVKGCTLSSSDFLKSIPLLKELDVRKSTIRYSDLVTKAHCRVSPPRIVPEGDLYFLLNLFASQQKPQFDSIIQQLVRKVTITKENFGSFFYLAVEKEISLLETECRFWLSSQPEIKKLVKISFYKNSFHITISGYSDDVEILLNSCKTKARFRLDASTITDLKKLDQFIEKFSDTIYALELADCGPFINRFWEKLSSVQELYLSCHRNKNQPTDSVSKLASLTKLVVYGIEQTQNVIENVKNLSLLSLELVDCQPISENFATKILTFFPRLQTLSLAGMQTINDQFLFKAPLSSLLEIDLSRTCVTDQGIQELIKKMPNLQRLTCDETEVSLCSVDLPCTLMHLSLSKCHNVISRTISVIARRAFHLRSLSLLGYRLSEDELYLLSRSLLELETIDDELPYELQHAFTSRRKYIKTFSPGPRQSELCQKILITRGIRITKVCYAIQSAADIEALSRLLFQFYDREMTKRYKRLRTIELTVSSPVDLDEVLKKTVRYYQGIQTLIVKVVLITMDTLNAIRTARESLPKLREVVLCGKEHVTKNDRSIFEAELRAFTISLKLV